MPLKHLLILLIPIVHHNYPVRSISGLGVGNLQYIYIQKAICIFIAGFPSDLGPVEPPLNLAVLQGLSGRGAKVKEPEAPVGKPREHFHNFAAASVLDDVHNS